MSVELKTVLRWEVPVDNLEHKIGGGPVVHVACRGRADVVDVWTEEPRPAALRPEQRYARVFGTGHPIDPTWEHAGTAVAPLETGLIWHVYLEPRSS
jgi:hypothetical protein